MVELDKYAKVSDYPPGKLLHHGRLQAGLTLEQVAKELYMTVSKVNALENDNYGNVNTHTFARGYIRAYANLLKMDVVVLLAAYDRHIANIIPGENDLPSGAGSTAAKKNSGKNKGAWHFFAFIIIFFVGLWLISVWFLDNRSEAEYILPVVDTSNVRHQSSSIISTLPQSEVMDAVALQENASSESISSDIVQEKILPTVQHTASSHLDTTTSSIASGSVVDKNVVQSASAALSSSMKIEAKKDALDEITFSFRAESWLEVSDSRGDVLATELELAGSKLSLVGKAPFDVKLGNAPAVDIQLNGKKIEVIPLLGTNVLVLKVSQ